MGRTASSCAVWCCAPVINVDRDELFHLLQNSRARGHSLRWKGAGREAMAAVTRGSDQPPAELAADKSFTCTFCGNGFTRSHALQQHMRIHAGEKAFTETSYVRTIASASRQRVKTGERLFICDVCGRRFTIASFLARHQQTHTAEQPLECDLCGKTFASAGNYREHQRQHDREETDRCDVCGDCYPEPHRLAEHQRSHLQREPYVCGVCGMSFSRLHYLQWHQRIHTGLPGTPGQRVTSTSPTRKVSPLDARRQKGATPALGGKRPAEEEEEEVEGVRDEVFAARGLPQEHRATLTGRREPGQPEPPPHSPACCTAARCRRRLSEGSSAPQPSPAPQHQPRMDSGGEGPGPGSPVPGQPDAGGGGSGSFICDLCGDDFVHWWDLQGHQRLHRPALPDSDNTVTAPLGDL